MKKTINLILATMLFSLICSGCANLSLDPQALAGRSIKDLEKARSTGKEKTLPLAYDTAFSTVTKILKKNGLAIYQSDKEKGYIVAIGFPQQVNTTRVGIFFESPAPDKTRITLSSLSSTALVKAETIIFKELEK